jgi:hypothetical protein
LATTIQKLVATGTGTITYSVPKAVSPFTVDTASGDLKITAALDYETKTSYVLVVE